ncbi:unnamed protein product [Adineta steineri]|uniref:BTB domain-containing protein n=1 Tax=Adineta steineri TaxID=433720 RepID=A0A813RS73_9BILA|nr:unnamed protein product [Adineta steineri]CAF0940717.1 unnamed protein product [Adineta steineri]
MDDDFLAEHVLPLMNLPNPSADISLDELIDSTNNNVHHTLLSTTVETGVEITLNATNEHVESTSKYFNNPFLSDIRLRVGTNSYYAHKFILAKSSDVLATLLYSHHWTSAEAEIILEEQDECHGDVFEKFLKFFYTAKVTLHETSVIGLLYLADKYNVQSLRNLCAQFMMLKAKPPNVRNSINWYSIAKQFSLDDLRDVLRADILGINSGIENIYSAFAPNSPGPIKYLYRSIYLSVFLTSLTTIFSVILFGIN